LCQTGDQILVSDVAAGIKLSG